MSEDEMPNLNDLYLFKQKDIQFLIWKPFVSNGCLTATVHILKTAQNTEKSQIEISDSGLPTSEFQVVTE